MNWETFYLVCFLVGFFFSLFSFLGGASKPHLHAGHGHWHATGRGGGRGQASPINPATFAAFLAWFGGAGYLLTRFSSVWAFLALALATAAGLAGASVVFWFLVKVMLKHDTWLDPADYHMTGVLGRASAAVRPGGTGEMIFVRDGARRVANIRSDTGEAIAKDAEVVVTRYERGIAYVQLFEELNDPAHGDREKESH